MSKKRWDIVISTKDKSGKARFTKVGAMFEGNNGGFSIVIDKGISVSTPEGTFLNAYEPKERDGNARPQQRQEEGAYTRPEHHDDTDIPF